MGVGVAEEVFDLPHGGGGVVAGVDDQPGAAAGDVGRGGAALGGGLAVRTGGALAGEAAGGDVGEEADEAQAGARDAVPDGDAEADEAVQAGGDDGEELGKDGVQAFAEFLRRMRGIRGGGGWVHVHFLFLAWAGGGCKLFC